MAYSDSFEGVIPLNNNFSLRVYFTYTQSVTDNSSELTVTGYVRRNKSSVYPYNSTSTVTLTVDGQSWTEHPSYNLGSDGWKKIISKTKTIKHEADGSRNVKISLYFDGQLSNYYPNGTISSTRSLNTIPRATTPTLSPASVTMGESITISLPRAVNAFTHTLQHDFYAGSWTTFATGAGTEASLAIPEDWATRIPNAESGTGSIRCLTYNGNTLIGEKTVKFTAKVPASVLPVISGITVTDADESIKTQFGAFIQYHSKLKLKIVASGSGGSTIKSGSISALGNTYSGIEATTDIVMTSGNSIKITASVTDSRGRTASHEMTIQVLPYTNPTINSFKAYRAESDGTASNTGASLKYEYSFSISECGGKNTKSYRVEYQTEGDDSWAELVSGSAYSANTSGKKDAVLTQENAYRVRIAISDFFTKSDEVTYELKIESSVYPIVFTPDLDGVGLCGFPRGKGVWVLAPARFVKEIIALAANSDGSDMDIVAEIKAIKVKLGI